MKLVKSLAGLALCLLLVGGMVYAQGVGASGSIRGSVTDPSGAVVANANVTAVETDKGIRHTATTSSDGPTGPSWPPR